MNDSPVVFAETGRDIHEREIGHFSNEEHGDMTSFRHALRPLLPVDHIHLDVEVLGNGLLDFFKPDKARGSAASNEVGKNIIQPRRLDLLISHRRDHRNADKGTLQNPDVTLDPLNDGIDQFIGNEHAPVITLPSQNRRPSLKLRTVNLSTETPLKSRDKTILERSNLSGRTITREDDLPSEIREPIEGVEELLLKAFFPTEKLNVINEKKIRFAVLLTERDEGVILNRIDVIVGELLCRHKEDARFGTFLQGRPTYPVEEVRFPKTTGRVKEKRLIRLPGLVRHRLRRRPGQITVLSRNKILESKKVNEPGGPTPFH